MNTNPRTWLKTGAVGLAGLAAGGVLAFTVSATADDNPNGDDTAQTGSRPGSDEQPLTGATADKVRAAALAEYPGATVLRVETDSDGVYEAHLTKADGTFVTVQVNKDFQVTAAEEGGFGHDGFGDHGDDDGDDGADDSSTQSSSTV